MTAATKALSATAGVLGRLIDGVYAGLATVADEAARIMSAAEVSRGMLEPLKPVVERFVRAQDGLVDSAGASTVPGQLTDAETWHQWWSLVDGQLIFITHNLNPASVNYYDYADMTWFERPVTSGHPELIGPYIDFGGADTKILTASQPVRRGGQIVAVAGADLSMDFVERAFLRSLGRREEHIALITESGKVVASNSARFAPGTRFEGTPGGLASVPVPVEALATPPWQLIVAG